jgi:hypothetical protein
VSDGRSQLVRGDFAGADPNRGRFRDLLKTPARVAEELAAVGLWEHVKDFLPDDWAATGVLRE